MMIRNKRILEDLEEREDFFPKAADDILTKKDQAPKHIEVSTDGNPVLNKEGEKKVLTPPQVSVPFPQRLKNKSEYGQFARYVEML